MRESHDKYAKWSGSGVESGIMRESHDKYVKWSGSGVESDIMRVP